MGNFIKKSKINIAKSKKTEYRNSTVHYNSADHVVNDARKPQSRFYTDLIEYIDKYSKSESKNILSELVKNGYVLRIGNDKDLRPEYVGAQLDLEKYLTLLLLEGEITHITGIIHTPTPPTPLCKEINNSSIDDTHTGFEDRRRAFTVSERAVYLRKYLKKGGLIYAVYPSAGINKRTKDEMRVYEKELHENVDTLFDAPLDISKLPERYHGATYFFTLSNNENLVFSIKSFQANDAKDGREWGLWLGDDNNDVVMQRVAEIIDFLSSHEGF